VYAGLSAGSDRKKSAPAAEARQPQPHGRAWPGLPAGEVVAAAGTAEGVDSADTAAAIAASDGGRLSLVCQAAPPSSLPRLRLRVDVSLALPPAEIRDDGQTRGLQITRVEATNGVSVRYSVRKLAAAGSLCWARHPGQVAFA